MYPLPRLFCRALLLAALIPTASPAQSIPPPAPTAPVAGDVPPVAEQARRAGLFTFYFENDYFGGTDQNYTNGVKFSWMTADLSDWGHAGWRRSVLEALPFINRDETQKNFAFSLGQQIYTPTNRDLVVPDPTDRPYAGWSYLELSFISKNHRRVDILSVQAGIVGPSARAAQTQRGVHDALGQDSPLGWDYQLRDEPGVNVVYERRYRAYGRALGGSLGVDLIPHGGFSLGNVQTFVNAGATLRLGFNLPSDFGVQLARAASVGAGPIDDADPRVAADRDVSLFLFAGADGRAVARDIFLDGNTWKDSRSVDKKPFVADLQAGIGFIAGRWQLTATFVHRTQEFKTQPDPHTRFGSVSLSVAF